MNPGAYTVTLTAAGAGGTNILALTNYVVVSYPQPVVMGGFTWAGAGGFQFTIGNSDGTPISAAQLSQIEVYAATDITEEPAQWVVLSNAILLTNGTLQVSDTNSVSSPQMFYRVAQVFQTP